METDIITRDIKSIINFENIWLINYSLFFVAALSLLNMQFIKSVRLGKIVLLLIGIAVLFFLTKGLYTFSELREYYLIKPSGNIFNIIIRYISFLFVAFAMFAGYIFAYKNIVSLSVRRLVEVFLHISILWILSSELIHWLDIAGFRDNYRMGLSILWGMYALVFIVLGIWKKKKVLRFEAIFLFGITLLKLIVYDVSNLDTISKTIVFVLLGVLLLVISFLYNKYKNKIFEAD